MAHAANIIPHPAMAKAAEVSPLEQAIAAHADVASRMRRNGSLLDKLFEGREELWEQPKAKIGVDVTARDNPKPIYAYSRKTIRKHAAECKRNSRHWQRDPSVFDRAMERQLRDFDNAAKRIKRLRDRAGLTALRSEQDQLAMALARSYLTVMMAPCSEADFGRKRTYLRRHMTDLSWIDGRTPLYGLMIDVATQKAA